MGGTVSGLTIASYPDSLGVRAKFDTLVCARSPTGHLEGQCWDGLP